MGDSGAFWQESRCTVEYIQYKLGFLCVTPAAAAADPPHTHEKIRRRCLDSEPCTTHAKARLKQPAACGIWRAGVGV